MEYKDDDESTWRYYPPPESPTWIQDELTRIGGKNRYGRPNLRVVWGADAKSESAEDRSRLKYFCGYSPEKVTGWRYEKDGKTHFTEKLEEIDPSIMVFPEIQQKELGHPRWIIEKWSSPEQLERMGRFQKRYAPGDVSPTLRKMPQEGVYDCYLVVENLENKYRPIDRDIIEFVRLKWWYDQKPFEERERERDVLLKKEQEIREKEIDELARAAGNFDLKLPKEEKERRERYWREKVNHQLQEEIAQRTGRWFVPEIYHGNTETA